MPCDYHLLPHEGIQRLAPYSPGKSIEQVAHEEGLAPNLIIKLASNENSLGCSPLVMDALKNLSAQQLATYPTLIHNSLRKTLLTQLHIDADMLTLSNGTDAFFPLILTCFCLHRDKHVLTHEHAFIAYQIYAQIIGIPVIKTPLKSNWAIDIDAIINAATEKTGIIFYANPNNPTGSYTDYSEIKRLLDHIPETTILVLDEAYLEYTTHLSNISSLDILKAHPNLIITRTFSKAYGLAGLRLGYAISSPGITSILQRALPPFSLNQAALIAGEAALHDTDFIIKTQHMNNAGREQLTHACNELNLPYLPVHGNFITINCQRNAMPIFLQLQQKGVIVRPLHPYGLTDYLRVTIGTHQQNKQFLMHFKELYHDE